MLIDVGQMAKLLGISGNGVRYLEDEGLVHPAQDEDNGHRRFTLEGQAAFYIYKP